MNDTDIIVFQDPPLGSCVCNCGEIPYGHINHVCAHKFDGWRDFEDGSGGEAVCIKCGMGAMYHSLHTGM